MASTKTFGLVDFIAFYDLLFSNLLFFYCLSIMLMAFVSRKAEG